VTDHGGQIGVAATPHALIQNVLETPEHHFLLKNVLNVVQILVFHLFCNFSQVPHIDSMLMESAFQAFGVSRNSLYILQISNKFLEGLFI
jgi:hypothetical protein